jgi:hypothetical protein
MMRISFHSPCIPQNTRPSGKNEGKGLLSDRHGNTPILTPSTPTTGTLISPHPRNSTHPLEEDNMISLGNVSDKEGELPLPQWRYNQWNSRKATRAHGASPHPAVKAGLCSGLPILSEWDRWCRECICSYVRLEPLTPVIPLPPHP